MSTVVVADLDRRFRAYVVDLLLAGGLALGLGLAIQRGVPDERDALALLLTLVGVVGVCAGLAVLLGTTGRTPGLATAGLRVVSAVDGRPIGVGRALARVLLVALATVPCGLGVVALAWTALTDPAHRRRGWHDRLVASVVVEEQPPSAMEPERSGAPSVVNLTAARLVRARRTTVAPGPAAARPAVATRREPARWGLVLDDGAEAPVGPGCVLGASQARVEVAPDGALVVIDLGSAHGTELVRRGAARRLGAGRPATLLEGDVVDLGDAIATVVRLG